jgi:hypothetical protein
LAEAALEELIMVAHQPTGLKVLYLYFLHFKPPVVDMVVVEHFQGKILDRGTLVVLGVVVVQV